MSRRMLSISGGGSGSGTVTNTGTLTSGSLLKGNGTTDITVADLTGDATTSGTVATTVVATHLSAALPINQGGTATTAPGFSTLTDGATVTWALASALVASAGLTFTVHSGNRTLNITGPVTGGTYALWIKQDSTGGEGLILGTGCTWKVSGGGSGAITPSVGANAVDVLAFTYDGTNCYANFNKNFT